MDFETDNLVHTGAGVQPRRADLVRPLRYPLLVLGLLLHLGIEYSLNIPMFEWDVLTAYVLFIDPADLLRMGRAARDFLLRRTQRTLSA